MLMYDSDDCRIIQSLSGDNVLVLRDAFDFDDDVSTRMLDQRIECGLKSPAIRSLQIKADQKPSIL
jgi:hypothetical protein